MKTVLFIVSIVLALVGTRFLYACVPTVIGPEAMQYPCGDVFLADVINKSIGGLLFGLSAVLLTILYFASNRTKRRKKGNS